MTSNSPVDLIMDDSSTFSFTFSFSNILQQIYTQTCRATVVTKVTMLAIATRRRCDYSLTTGPWKQNHKSESRRLA